ncbi:LuxR C-terminal-related transcriptional regulator [Cupriavidus malaysiensis]|nr:LuxR C-terminal-related transcriptional regulator [Cupriavidus malaysiensis]
MAGTGNNDKMTGWAGVLMPCVDTQVRTCGEQQEARRGLPLPMRADGLPDGGGKDGAAGCALAPVADESQAVGAMLPGCPGDERSPHAQAVALPMLSARQASVYALLVDGLSNKRIALLLGLQEGTVKEHVSAILAKHCVRDRRQLIRQAPLPAPAAAAPAQWDLSPAMPPHTPCAGVPRQPITPAELGLTRRQGDVLQLLLDGLSNRVIGRRLGLREDTVKEHVSAILMALKTPRRAQVMALMRQFELHLCPES